MLCVRQYKNIFGILCEMPAETASWVAESIYKNEPNKSHPSAIRRQWVNGKRRRMCALKIRKITLCNAIIIIMSASHGINSSQIKYCLGFLLLSTSAQFFRVRRFCIVVGRLCNVPSVPLFYYGCIIILRCTVWVWYAIKMKFVFDNANKEEKWKIH